MEVADEFFGVNEIFDGLPGAMIRRFFISNPFHQIFDFVANFPTVENSGNFIFFLAFNLNRGRRRLSAVRNGIFLKWFEKVNTKHGMKSFHGIRKSETIGMRRNLL